MQSEKKTFACYSSKDAKPFDDQPNDVKVEVFRSYFNYKYFEITFDFSNLMPQHMLDMLAKYEKAVPSFIMQRMEEQMTTGGCDAVVKWMRDIRINDRESLYNRVSKWFPNYLGEVYNP